MKSYLKYFLVFSIFFSYPLFVFAIGPLSESKTDLSVSETDIISSKDAPVAGDSIKIYVRVFNIGDTDVNAFVNFLNNGKEMSSPQPISIRPNTYDDVFIDWKAVAGTNIIMAKIVGANPTDDNAKNNTSTTKEIKVTDTQKSTESDVILRKNEVAAVSETATPATETKVEMQAESLAFLPADVQQGLDNFANSNPIKSSIQALNNKITEQAAKWFNLNLLNSVTDNKKDQNSFDHSKLTANISGAFKDTNNYIYAALAIVFLTILFLFWRAKKNRDEEY